MDLINGIFNFIESVFNFITNAPAVIYAFVVYWFIGWGLVIVGFYFFIKWIWIFIDDYYITSKTEKTFRIIAIVLIGAMLWFIPERVMHHAIDVDPYHMTKEEKQEKHNREIEWD